MPMTKRFTENDLIQYMYGELNAPKKQSLENELIKNEAFQDQLFAFQSVKRELDQLEISPSKGLKEKILHKVSSIDEVSI